MGYTERPCIICACHFNMARLRRITEPLSAGWDMDRDHWRPGEDLNGDENSENPSVIIPHRMDGHIIGYTCDGEYRSFCIEGKGIDEGSACAQAGCSEADGDHACGGFGCGFVLDDGEGEGIGYNGWRIEETEMRIMTCVQAVVPLDDEVDWQPEDDDDEYERSSKFRCVLTAVSESAPDEFSVTHVPYRHGIGGELMICEGDYGESGWGVPFHGPCYRILKRVVKERELGINILDGLLLLRNDRGHQRETRHAPVEENDDQWWRHIPGTEYLAADPVSVPKLDAIVAECTASPRTVSPGVFAPDELARRASQISQLSTDPFFLLPPELKRNILDMLDYRDVACLRLATRAWRQLPQTFFRDLILERMPWVWEARDLMSQHELVDWYTLWQKLSRIDGGKEHIDNSGRRVKRSFKAPIDYDGRANGLVNRRRIWREVGLIVDKLVKLLEDVAD